MKYEKEGLKTDVRKLVFNQATVLFKRPATSPDIKSNQKLTLTIQPSVLAFESDDRSLSLTFYPCDRLLLLIVFKTPPLRASTLLFFGTSIFISNLVGD